MIGPWLSYAWRRAVYDARRILPLAKSIVAELLVRISDADLQLLPSRCAETFFDVSHGKRGHRTGRLAVCRRSYSSGQCSQMLANRLRSQRWRNCGIGGALLVSGFIYALLRSRVLLYGVGTSRHRAFLK